jgi:hypothetical protein
MQQTEHRSFASEGQVPHNIRKTAGRRALSNSAALAGLNFS